MIVKILLQNYCGGLRINPLATLLRNDRGRIPFVNQNYRNSEPAMHLIRKAPAAHCHFVLDAIRMTRQSDYAATRLPLRYQQRDFSEFRIVGVRLNDGQRLRLFQQAVADCHPDSLQAEVERQQGFH